MSIHQPLPDLHLVDLDLPREGFRSFIGAWVLRRGEATVVVDPGPRATLPVLIDALEELGVHRLDAVLLTHIHIDHAGGAGLLLDLFPEAKVLCHPKGIPHLLDPSKLWAGSLKILGELAELYGEIAPVPAERIGHADTLEAGSLRVEVADTPGHAPHHLCFRAGDLLFAGEVLGVRYELPSGPYQRPATPPVFHPEVLRRSIDKSAGLGARHLCFGHYGHIEDVAGAFRTARSQLETWLAVVEKHLREGSEPFEEAVFRELLEIDPAFSRLRELPWDVQKRERHFFANTVSGMRGHLEGR